MNKSLSYIPYQSEGEAESPFAAPDFQVIETEPETAELSEFEYLEESPFQHNFREDDLELSEETAEEAASFISELHDEEFNDALYELMQEASQIYETELSESYVQNPIAGRKQAAMAVNEAFAPFFREMDEMFEQMMRESEERDLESMTDSEIDNWVDGFTLNPEFEQSIFEHGLLKRWRKKIKKVTNKIKNKVKGAVKKAAKKFKKVARKAGRKVRKGIKKVRKFAKKALFRILGRLKKIAKRLLKGVLKYALNKIPPHLQDAAKLLKSALFKREIIEESETENDEELEAIGLLQNEFNYQIAHLVFNEEEENIDDEEVLNESELISETAEISHLDELHEAEERFANQISELSEDEDPTPHIEEFVGATLASLYPVLKSAITIAGRSRVIKFLAKYIARLVRKFLKRKRFRKFIPLISKAITDVGLRTVGLETLPEEDQAYQTAQALTGVVKETILNVAQLPEYLLRDEQLLEGHVLDAFEQAVTSNMPQILSEETYRKNPRLRDSKIKGTWLRFPLKRKRRKKYKKFSKRLKTRLKLRKAKALKSFGKKTLYKHLKEQMGVSPTEEIEAYVHLYEALPGANISDIVNEENRLLGLKNGYQLTADYFHPLTPETAGMLMDESGMGRKVAKKYLRCRRAVKSGQRFFRLEIPGSRMMTLNKGYGISGLRRLTELNVVLDFVRDRLKICLFLSESDAQEVSALLRSSFPFGTAVGAVLKNLNTGLDIAFSPEMFNRRKIVHGAVLPGSFSGRSLKRIPPLVTEQLESRIMDWVAPAVKTYLKEHRSDWIKTAEHESDGATLIISMNHVPGFQDLKLMLYGKSFVISPKIFFGEPGTVQVNVKPGYAYE